MENQNVQQGLDQQKENQFVEARQDALRTPGAIEHRMEFVDEVNGVEYINDSKATDVNSSWYSLECMEKPVVWIIEASKYEEDYSLFGEIATDKVKALVVLGEDADVINAYFEGRIPAIQHAKDIHGATLLSAAHAVPGDVVLFSPACSAFEMYRNYNERGQQFRKAVREMQL